MHISKNYCHVIWRVPTLLIWMLVMPLLFVVMRLCKCALHTKLPHIFHRGVRNILGISIQVTGARTSLKPTLYISNHISYLDVFVLGDIPAFFVAKSEVASWPILGYLAKFQNTLFIERSPGKAKHSLNVMQQHIRNGNSLILFPEGTSTEGTHVEPFKSSLFESVNLQEEPSADKDEPSADKDEPSANKEEPSANKAEPSADKDEPSANKEEPSANNEEPSANKEATSANKKQRTPIQAITVAYTHQGGMKMNQAMLDHYAWYAVMPFAPHFFKLFALKKVDVKVHFHPIVYLEDFETRKNCADYCRTIIADQLDLAIAD